MINTGHRTKLITLSNVELVQLACGNDSDYILVVSILSEAIRTPFGSTLITYLLEKGPYPPVSYQDPKRAQTDDHSHNTDSSLEY